MTRDWVPVCAGPVAWFCAHVASWMLVPGAHEDGRLVGLYLVDLIALAISILAGVLALGRVRALREVPAADRRDQGARFLAASGLALSALSILLLIGLTMPIFLLSPGAEP